MGREAAKKRDCYRGVTVKVSGCKTERLFTNREI